MRLIKLFPVLLIILPLTVFAGDKELTIHDAIILSRTKLAPANLKQLTWLPKGDRFSWVENDTLFARNVISKTSEMLLTVKDFSDALHEKGKRRGLKLPRLTWRDKTTLSFWKRDTLRFYSTESRAISRQIPLADYSGGGRKVSPDGQFVAFTKDNNLYLANSKSTKPVTSETSKDIVSGQAVSRQEFGIRGGIFWSPDSKLLAFYQKDESQVTDYPYVDYTDRPAKSVAGKYPMAGMASETVRIGVYDLESEKAIWLDTADPEDAEQYLTAIAWTPDSKKLLVAHINRDQDHLRMNLYDAGSGKKIRQLFEESDEQYIDPQDAPYFVPGSTSEFVWLSERDGWKHYYLYNTDGQLIRQLTKGEWDVAGHIAMDEKGEYVFYTAATGSPIERHVFKTRIADGRQQSLTPKAGSHRAKVSADGHFLIDTFSELNTPRVISLLDGNGKTLETLLTADDPLAEYGVGEVELVNVTAQDGTTLYGRLLLPPGFDVSKKYPVIVYVYGGPHSQLIRNMWGGGASLYLRQFATRGFVVFTVDGRGTDFRGLDFEQTTHRRLGTVEVDDQLDGVNYLKSLPYVDAERIGVFGWSYGGFMATSMMVRTPGVYKVGVAGAPVIDWKYYEVMYTERYMDRPQQNEEGYETASTLSYVKDLQGKLLIIHGTSDATVMWQNSINFVKKAISEDKQIDYMIYPGHLHGVRGKDRVHLFTKILNYFVDNL